MSFFANLFGSSKSKKVEEVNSPTSKESPETVKKAETLVRFLETDESPKQNEEASNETLVLPQASEVNKSLGIIKENEVPRDSFSLLIYVLLLDAHSESETYFEFIQLLNLRNTLEARLNGLNSRIEKLVTDTSERSDIFENSKFEKHISDYENEDLDTDEKMQDNLDLVENLPQQREALMRSVLLLAKLESYRLTVNEELSSNLLELKEKLPRGVNDRVANNVDKIILERLEQLKAIDNMAISDGEWSGDSSDEKENLDDFLTALDLTEDEMVHHTGDSAFSLN